MSSLNLGGTMRLVLALLAIISINASASTISQTDLDRVAEDIDNICGDTWCEGDFDWGHTNLRCDFEQKECSIDLTLISWFEASEFEKEYADFVSEMVKVPDFYEDANEDDRFLMYDKVCYIGGIETVSDVMIDGSYSEKIYDGVLDCVTEMEEEYYSYEENFEK